MTGTVTTACDRLMLIVHCCLLSVDVVRNVLPLVIGPCSYIVHCCLLSVDVVRNVLSLVCHAWNQCPQHNIRGHGLGRLGALHSSGGREYEWQQHDCTQAAAGGVDVKHGGPTAHQQRTAGDRRLENGANAAQTVLRNKMGDGALR
jgi:hypothetical protein